MAHDEPMILEKLRKRQARPATGEVFRIKVVDGRHFFGLVVDADLDGPMGPGAILAVILAGSSESGEPPAPDELRARPLLIPPFIVNQRPWTLGYAERIALRADPPDVPLVFWHPVTQRYVDSTGRPIASDPPDPPMVGDWSVGNELTLADSLTVHLRQAP